jgi:hypothetical protein
LVSSYPSKYLPHVSKWLPLEGFLWNLIMGTSMKIRRGNRNLVKIGQKYRTIYMRKLVRSYCWQQYEISVLRQQYKGNSLKHF